MAANAMSNALSERWVGQRPTHRESKRHTFAHGCSRRLAPVALAKGDLALAERATVGEPDFAHACIRSVSFVSAGRAKSVAP
jgi:hypothetical protein